MLKYKNEVVINVIKVGLYGIKSYIFYNIRRRYYIATQCVGSVHHVTIQHIMSSMYNYTVDTAYGMIYRS